MNSPAPVRPLPAILMLAAGIHAQVLLVDRPWPDSGPAAPIPPAPAHLFAADRFTVGTKGETWVLDRVRAWGTLSGEEKIALWGGLESRPLRPGELECDCHNLREIQNGGRISRAGPEVWQVDFDELNWSVPGGEAIQFGFRAARWSAFTHPAPGAPPLELFDEKGKPGGAFAATAAKELTLQVWGHLPAVIEIRRRGAFWEVTLRETITLNAAGVDRASLRFGPKAASADGVERDGSALVATFREDEAGVASAERNACLKGRRLDGVPFEGCDLLPR